MNSGYPIVLDVSRRLVVVVGGGAVGLRKVKGLLAGGAQRLRVVSLAFDPQMPASIERVEAEYQAAHVHGADLVFAATDSADVNDRIVQDARAGGALVCRADVDEEHAGDFSTPAMLRDGPLLVTVSSGGSPVMSAMIRDRLAKTMDPRWPALAAAMRELRPWIKAKVEPARRKAVFVALGSDGAVEALGDGDVEALRRWLQNQFEELKAE